MADKVEKAKKRKRPADGSSKPSKRVAIDIDKQVHLTLQQTDKWAPIIASTPGLAISSSISLKPYTKKRRNAPLKSGSGEIATKELLLHSSQHPKLDYTAREEEAGGIDTLLKHYIGVYDPETGTLDVMEARKMVVRGTVRAHQATADDVVSTNMREMRNELGQTFGTKKAKKAIASVTENAIAPDRAARMEAQAGRVVKLDAAASAMLANMAEATKGMATKEEMAAAADAAKPRPAANLATDDATQVYTVESLIGLDTMKKIPILDWTKKIKANENIITSFRFPSSRIGANPTNLEKLKILRYMVLLLGFFNETTPNREGRKLPDRSKLKDILGGMPEAVLEGVKRKFTDGSTMSKFKADLLITHLCAMSLLVDNFETDMFDLGADLKLEPKQMQVYYREIGTKLVALPVDMQRKLGLDRAAAAQRKIARLRLPLDFPKLMMGRKK